MELWERLMDLGQRPEEPDAEEVNRLVESLARSPEFAGWAINTLNDPAIDDRREVFCVELLGRMRHRPACGLVVEKLKAAEADDWMADKAIDALAHIGSVEVVGQIRQQFGSMKEFNRSVAAEALGRIKLSQSEAALTALLAGEPDLLVKTSLAAALCELATTESAALDRLASMVAAGQWQRDALKLDEDVAGLFQMVGRAIPKAASSSAHVFSPSAPVSPLKWDDDRDEELSLPAASVAPSAQASAPPAPGAPKPIRRDAAKVGRNDPCPCGSGKKYKKCCGQ
jgi:preprotein translocase subunit SecA